MRRSLAPSQSLEAKRGRFVPSFKKTSGIVHVGSSNVIPYNIGLTSCHSNASKRSPLDILKIVENIETVSNSTDIQTAVVGSAVVQFSDEKVTNISEGNKIDAKSGTSNDESTNDNIEKYFKVVWCKRSTRKHKKWEGDAIIAVKKRSVIMKDMDGKIIGSAMGYKHSELEKLEEGSQLIIGGKEIEIMETISEKDYGSGICFREETTPEFFTDAQLPKTTEFKKPFQNPSKLIETRTPIRVTPRYDPSKAGAIVMPRPNATEKLSNSEIDVPFVDVVIDPTLSKKLREHQKVGVIFLYECLAKIRQFNGQGAILADEMGLGKTLQCVALLWTMLKQGPYGGRPLIKRALIITPSSLMKNWLKEFNLWLGQEKLRVCLANQSDKIELYLKAQVEPVMITSYELAVKHHELLEKIKFDIMICDEGHRLKNTSTKTTSLLGQLPIKKRIALTGTPIQNDLQEFFSLVDFCNPGILGSIACFKKIYEEPIIKSKQPSASKIEISLGEMRSAELSRLTSQFILRRTQDVNNQYLPSKTEYVVFCKPSQLQLDLYSAILSSRCIKSCLTGNCKDGSFHLVCISGLKKLSSHPSLIFQASREASELPPELAENSPYAGLFSHFPEDFEKYNVPPRELSGKLNTLAIILNQIKLLVPRERVVLVSNSTKTLDMLESLCKIDKHTVLRLDGSTPLKNRQDLVDRFNASYSDTFIFLLSSKAGGVGLNLIGASRLILFDIDWNPANDLQAMSRVWRDGQSKRVHIYRLLTTGTIEEKIYQRQITKHSLTTVLAKGTHTKMQFSIDDLKDLFRLDIESMCTTHDLMECNCTTVNASSSNLLIEEQTNRAAQLTIENTWNKSKNLTIDEFMSWKHISGRLIDNNIKDSCLESASDTITFLFYNFVNQETSKI